MDSELCLRYVFSTARSKKVCVVSPMCSACRCDYLCDCAHVHSECLIVQRVCLCVCVSKGGRVKNLISKVHEVLMADLDRPHPLPSVPLTLRRTCQKLSLCTLLRSYYAGHA